MKKLDLETLRDVVRIDVRKSDWSMSFSTVASGGGKDESTLLIVNPPSDERLWIGSEKGRLVILDFLNHIFPQGFIKVKETHIYERFVRVDHLGQ